MHRRIRHNRSAARWIHLPACAPAFVHLRNPLELSNWTLPVLELMLVSGAVVALVHSICRLRREGDPVNLALLFATVVYLFVIEIPLYCPNVFGVQDRLGVVFAHNVFSVQFLAAAAVHSVSTKHGASRRDLRRARHPEPARSEAA